MIIFTVYRVCSHLIHQSLVLLRGKKGGVRKAVYLRGMAGFSLRPTHQIVLDICCAHHTRESQALYQPCYLFTIGLNAPSNKKAQKLIGLSFFVEG